MGALKNVFVLGLVAVLVTITFMKLLEFFTLWRKMQDGGRMPIPGEYNMMINPWACRFKVYGSLLQAIVFGVLAYVVGRFGFAFKL